MTGNLQDIQMSPIDKLCLTASKIYSSMDVSVDEAVNKAMATNKKRDNIVENDNKEPVQTIRLDLKSRICFMASQIYSSLEIEVDEAIERAVAIENAADAKVKQMKSRNPIFPQARRRFTTPYREKEKLPTQ